jgi:hypothetical protein
MNVTVTTVNIVSGPVFYLEVQCFAEYIIYIRFHVGPGQTEISFLYRAQLSKLRLKTERESSLRNYVLSNKSMDN